MTTIPMALIVVFAVNAWAAPILISERDWQSGFWASLAALAALAGVIVTSGWFHV